MSKRRLKGIICGYHDRVGTNIDGAVLGVLDMAHECLLTHDRDAYRCKDEIWVVAFLPSCTVELFR